WLIFSLMRTILHDGFTAPSLSGYATVTIISYFGRPSNPDAAHSRAAAYCTFTTDYKNRLPGVRVSRRLLASSGDSRRREESGILNLTTSRRVPTRSVCLALSKWRMNTTPCT
ncbi:hypothetical protein OTU49_002850, partial [Cherax quadricarinatus]